MGSQGLSVGSIHRLYYIHIFHNSDQKHIKTWPFTPIYYLIPSFPGLFLIIPATGSMALVQLPIACSGSGTSLTRYRQVKVTFPALYNTYKEIGANRSKFEGGGWGCFVDDRG